MGKIADILMQQGQVEEALRIRQEEELPVYEKLGAIREKAVTMGQIADILAQQGQVEEALRIRQEEQLPVYEKLGAIREKAVTLFKIAMIQIETGGLKTEKAQEIYEALSSAFAISLQIKEPGIIVPAGSVLAQVLLSGGQQDQAFEILNAADTVLTELNYQDGLDVIDTVAQATELSRRIGQNSSLMANSDHRKFLDRRA